jgi:ankyrin repeat protein
VNISRLSQIIPGILKQDLKLIDSVIDDHISGVFQICTPRSRFVNGTSLLHVVASLGNHELLDKVLSLVDLDYKPLNPNCRDQRGATALHKSTDIKIIKTLIEYGANVNLTDLDGNTPLHSRCLGENNKTSELEAIEILLNYKSNFLALNKEVFIIVKYIFINNFIIF